PKQETLAQFNERMRSLGAADSYPAGVSHPSSVVAGPAQIVQQPRQTVPPEGPANPGKPAFANTDYKTWNIQQLKEFAAAEEVDLAGAATIDAIRKRIADYQRAKVEGK